MTLANDTIKSKKEFGTETSISIWTLRWRRFYKNKLAFISGIILICLYVVALNNVFFAPYRVQERFRKFVEVPPQVLRFFDSEGNFHLRPFVYGLKREIDRENYRSIYSIDTSKKYPIYFFVHNKESRLLWNFFPINICLFGVKGNGTIFLLGTDTQGRDLLTRIIVGTKISLTIGLLGVFISLSLGSILGIVSGYFGGHVDNIIQRVAEIIMCFPQIPLWMALAAIMPPEWSSVKSFFMIIVILSLITWCQLARQIRGKVLALKEEDYIMAAKSLGASTKRIIFKYFLRDCMSHIIVIGTLSIPGIIMAETTLSFLGLGIRPPMVSLGVLLQKAQHMKVLVQTPWIVTPVIFVILIILCFNALGDGLRDAFDPYAYKR